MIPNVIEVRIIDRVWDHDTIQFAVWDLWRRGLLPHGRRLFCRTWDNRYEVGWSLTDFRGEVVLPDVAACRKCGSENLSKRGKDRRGVQRYGCAECDFTSRSLVPRRNGSPRKRGRKRADVSEESLAAFKNELAVNPNWTLRGACRAANINHKHGRTLLERLGIRRLCRTCQQPITGKKFWFCSDKCQRWRKVGQVA